MNILEIVSAIENDISQGVGSSNFRVPQEQIRDMVHVTRASLIEQLQQQKTNRVPLSGVFFNTIIVNLEEIPPEIFDHDSLLHAQQSEIPRCLWKGNIPMVNYAGDFDRNLAYRITTVNDYLNVVHNEFTANIPTCWIEPHRVVVFNDSVDRFKIRGCWFDPDALLDIESDYTELMPYPASGLVIDNIIKLVGKHFIEQYFRMQPHQKDGLLDTQGLEQLDARTGVQPK